jgi:hypothetical protein
MLGRHGGPPSRDSTESEKYPMDGCAEPMGWHHCSAGVLEEPCNPSAFSPAGPYPIRLAESTMELGLLLQLGAETGRNSQPYERSSTFQSDW